MHFVNRVASFGLASLACLVLNQSASASDEAQNKRFEALRTAIFSNPYQELPHYKVNRKLFGKPSAPEGNKLRQAADRTFSDERDLLEFPDGQKLLQANGICFAGVWSIGTQSDYTGLFAKNALSPVIVRTSVAFSGTRRKNKRALGMAIKLLPEGLNDLPSLNVFVMHTMGGVVTKHTLDLSLDNQPPLGNLPRWSDLGTALRLRRDFEQADRDHHAVKPQINFRPVDHLAHYQTNNRLSSSVRSPKWLRLTSLNTRRMDIDDFREELDVKHYSDNTLRYQIEVAVDHGKKKSTATWQRIGLLHLTESVTSGVCDQQLHFQHPTLASDGNSETENAVSRSK